MTGIIDDIVQNDPRYSFGTKGEDKPGEAKTEENVVDQQETIQKEVPTETETAEIDSEENKENKELQTPSAEELVKNLLSGVNERLGTQYQDFETLKKDYSQLNTLRESEKRLKDQLVKVSNPFGDDTELAEMYGFKKATNRNLNDYFILKNLDIENADSLDVMVANAILENPNLRGKELLVRQAFEKKYQLAGQDLEESDIESNKITLDIDSSAARKSLRDLKAKIKAPELDNPYSEEDSKNWKEHEQQWEQIVPAIAKNLESFKIFEDPDDEQKGKDPLTTIDIPKEVIADYNKKVTQYIADNRLENTTENQNLVYGIMLQDYIVNNYLKIANAYSAKKIEANNKMWSQRTGVDISKLGQDVVPKENTSDVESFNKQELDKVLKRIGMRR